MNKKEYLPPAAELILLAPCERLAAWDTSFEERWFHGFNILAGASAGNLGIITEVKDDTWEDSGFVIKKG